MSPLRVVIDTNVYVSRYLSHPSTPGRAVAKVWAEDIPLISLEIWAEVAEVFARPKLARYLKPGTVQPFLDRILAASELVAISQPIRACRDPKDNKFLEAAVAGRADAILTGDEDLLAMHPFHGVEILSPAQFLARGGESGAADILEER
jgi:uncharacterized protein